MKTDLEVTVDARTIAKPELGSQPDTREERVLVDRCLAGDAVAWKELHSLYQGLVVAYLRKQGVSDAEIEDSAQEVFLQIYRNLGSFRGEAKLGTWIYCVCMTEAQRTRRRERMTTRVVRVVRERHHPDESLTGLDASDEAASRAVASALSRLNERERSMLVLHTFEGRDGREIADLTGTPVASVWRVLHYARRNFVAAFVLSQSDTDERRAACGQ
ncbi:MAG: sigma-70 family RNA polymerase sigma factor [Polyangiaceae bacterium]